MRSKIAITTIGDKRAARIRQHNFKMRKAAEERFNKYTHNLAKSLLNQHKDLTVYTSSDIAKFSVDYIIKDYAGKLAITDSIWAPWSKCFKK